MKKIVFTGGGSAGHVMPNIALMEELQDRYDLCYIGSDGVEKRIVAPLKIPYGQIACPKFVRGFSLRNFSIPLALRRAVKEAEEKLAAIRPDLVFSKGGYVALPVVFAAKRLKIPCLTHESDLTLGLANRLMAGRCAFVLTSFPETAESVINGRYTGSPLRRSVFGSDAGMARAKYGFASRHKPVLLVLGGGSGSAAINAALRKDLFSLCKKYYILHLCGRGNAVESNAAGYMQREFEEDMGAAYACADAVVARAGSNTVFETLALKKPALFIPLQNARTRGDQVKNARYFEERGMCRVLPERNLDNLEAAIDGLMQDSALRKNLKNCDVESGNERFVACMEELL